MENSIHDQAGFTQFEDENQVFIFIKDLVTRIFNSTMSYYLTAIHYIFLPVVLIYSFWAHALEQTWQITKHISHEVYELLIIIPLSIELWFQSAWIFVKFLLFIESLEEIGVDVEKHVYPILEKILERLRAFPLSEHNAAALYSFVKKLAIFGKGRLPFPHFLFKKTFTGVQYGRGVVSMTVAPPTNLSESGTEPQPSAEAPTPTPTPTSDQTRRSSVIPLPEAPVPSDPKSTATASTAPKKKSLVDFATPQATLESDVKATTSSS